MINRASPYYEKTGLSLSLGDHFSASVNTGMSTKEIDFSVCGFIENKDKGSVFYTTPEYLDFLAEINCDLAWYICTEDMQTKQAVEEIKALVASDNRINTSIFADYLSEYQPRHVPRASPHCPKPEAHSHRNGTLPCGNIPQYYRKQ